MATLDSFLQNCTIHPRPGDGPLFEVDGDSVRARLDGYMIVPKEDYPGFVDGSATRSTFGDRGRAVELHSSPGDG